jgi:hypothetical protein
VTDDDLDRRGMHPALGEVTLRQLLATWAVHDPRPRRPGLRAGWPARTTADVGPWKAYLGILLRRDDPAAVAVEPRETGGGAKADPTLEARRGGQIPIVRLNGSRSAPRVRRAGFITDDEEQDELGLARTVGPFDTPR